MLFGERSLNTNRPVEPRLITGFPRLLARALATEGIQRWNARKVFLLYEEAHQADIERFVESLPDEVGRRIIPVCGQHAGIDLRLSGSELTEIRTSVTHVFHAANDVSTPERRLHGTVGGLNQLLRLAREMPNLERFSLFSTAFVSGNRTGIVREEELDIGQRLRMTFEDAMMQSEKAVRAAMPRMPITVFRPSAMVGQWRLGEEIEVTEGPTYLLSLMLKLPVESPLFCRAAVSSPSISYRLSTSLMHLGPSL